jgi:uncharacterized membrane protein YfcA
MHDFNWTLSLGGFIVGIVVGMTGMGGGALMTPMLVFFFNINPLAAVSSDLVTSAVMKPFGAAVHLRNGTVDRRLVKWLCLGSVPCAFCGVLVARALGKGSSVDEVVQTALGIALIIAAGSLIIKSYIALVERARRRRGEAPVGDGHRKLLVVRPVPTVLVGAVGGLVVGMTSVGSGSLIIIALLALYPMLKASDLVGTDLLQAVPLVASAALGHLLFGDFHLDVTAALLVGSVPGVIIGSLISSKAPGGIVRRALALVLVASALKLLTVPPAPIVIILAGIVLVGPPLWAWARVRHGLPAFGRSDRHPPTPAAADAPDGLTGDVGAGVGGS